MIQNGLCAPLLLDLLLYHLPLSEGARALQRRQLLVQDPVEHLHVDRTLREAPRLRLATLQQLRNLVMIFAVSSDFPF